MQDIKRWTPDYRCSFSAGATEEMRNWMRQFGAEDHIDRGYYLQIYGDGGAGSECDLPDFTHCPLCGARYQ